MDWGDLRFVLAVGRTGSLAAAGRELGVDATTVGRRVTAIEKELDARLFDRTNEGFVATPRGDLVIERAANVEREILAIESSVSGSADVAEGRVRITGLDALFDGLIVPRLPSLLASHPRLELCLVSGLRMFDLSRFEAEIGIRMRAPAEPNLVGRRLGMLASGLYASPDLEIGPTPPLIGLAADGLGEMERAWYADRFPDGRVVVRANTESHLISLARAGVGVALIDCFIGDSDPGLRRVVPEPLTIAEAWAIAPLEMRQTSRVRVVLDFLRDVFAENQARLVGTP